MNTHEYRFLLSERVTLRKLIDDAPPGSIITKMSFENRLRRVEEQLESYEGFSPRVVNARLTFRGKPVVENHGIRAEFGPDATAAFTEAVAEVGRGWGGKKEDYGLLITGIARGSFGFEVEDASQMPPLEGESTPVEAAMEQVKDILKATTGSDDELASAIAFTDDNALEAIRKFLETVADSDAMCALELQGDKFSFRSVDEVRFGAERLDHRNITVEDVDLSGHFQGFMPKGRRAEFVVAGTGDVITARVQASVAESVLNKEMVDEPIRVKARVRRVGASSPTYVITSYYDPASL